MITLFRRMREKLIQSGSLSKYLLYAIGEIALVVIGILIALQINNWNEESKAQQELIQYLTTIKTDIINDQVLLDSLKIERTEIVKRTKAERLNILNKTYDFMTTQKALLSYLDFYFVPNNSGYESLKNSPYLGRINGSKLNDLLVDYNSGIVAIAQNEKSFNEFLENLEARLAFEQDRTIMMAYIFMDKQEFEATKTTQQEVEQNFRDLHEKPAYRNIVSQAERQVEIIKKYDMLTKLGQQLIDEITIITKN